ncbi:CRISPR-associated endonuclease Cas2 [Candidatus Woesearchaeota archaeon]|nr:CRISPR-associated endonuclease Cas2 [Candidatus Woesearchaeota archaeon]
MRHRLMTASTRTWLVTYDISNNRRRTRLHKTLRAYGQPLQKSVFVCQLTTGKSRQMQRELDMFAREPTDRIHCVAIANPEVLPAHVSLWIME